MKGKLLWLVCLLSLAAAIAAIIIATEARQRSLELSTTQANAEQRVAALETIVNAHLAQASAQQPAAANPWDEALSDLADCGSTKQDMPERNELETLGFSGVLSKGYEMKVVCHDKASNAIGFIMAKKVLTKPTPESPETCVNDCDQDVLGILNPATKVLKYVESGKKLGLYGEAYDQSCLIDRVVLDGQAGEAELFYCGSGENGGMTTWYRYLLNGDQLTLVQQLKELGPPPTYDVKDPLILHQFTRQSQ